MEFISAVQTWATFVAMGVLLRLGWLLGDWFIGNVKFLFNTLRKKKEGM